MKGIDNAHFKPSKIKLVLVWDNSLNRNFQNTLQPRTFTLTITTDSTPTPNSILMPCAFLMVVVLPTHNVVITVLILEHMFFTMLLTKNAALTDLQQPLDHAKNPNPTRHNRG